MPRRSKKDRRSNEAAPAAAAAVAANDDADDDGGGDAPQVVPQVVPQILHGNSVSAAVRQRQREVAEREASRLARPEKRRSKKVLAHADRKKSGVTSTPFGVLHKQQHHTYDDSDYNETETEEWCGPFSIARQLISKREKKRKLEEEEERQQLEPNHPLDAAMEELEAVMKSKQHPSLLWKSSLQKQDSTNRNEESSFYAKRQKRADLVKQKEGAGSSSSSRIPSLFDLCIHFLVDHFDYVEEIGNVDNDVRLALSHQLLSRNQLDDRAFGALLEPSMEILQVPDCSGITQDAMAAALSNTKGLRYLLLKHAGRCFGAKTVPAFLKNETAQLACISIEGAYLLKDEDAARVLEKHAATLQSIHFTICPLLGAKFIEALESHVATKGNLLELSLEDVNFSTEQLEKLASCSSSDLWKNVKSIALKGVTGLTDEILSKILAAAGNSLDSLDVSNNPSTLTDATLSAIRQFNPRLRTLVMNGNKETTAAGWEAFFTHPLESLPPPPKLKVLKLSSIDYQAVTDEVMRLVTAGAAAASHQHDASNKQHDDSSAAVSSSYTRVRTTVGGGGLVQLDIQGSTLVTDTTLEQLVETSANTLESLNISYCPGITDNGVGYLVSKAGNQLKNIQVWGCAQLTENFFDGHSRVNDRTLQIDGAWMKKSGTSSL
ncbi:MAG: hypothetical protein SGARI_000925, partial [Bacillariaceae sp.]